ncbi:sodium:calcium antiporter [Litorimonas cladophorae]|uniref:Sodium:calcium antiporter n=1 Tax=Litorimonas cladophorae TaxID=1220491 RepID=A0A918KF12_9PROT|nr:calcium/sodium antiporter [Litorimonas cladophorae]GGX61122.1 sodium:calcium antiporter [Litorimonas cladophorae]
MITEFLILVIGLVVLIIAGDIMVRGAAALARHWGVPALIVGLTIVAFGTSAPEMVVGVQAALIGQGDLAAGNVVGSNIANVLLALGLPALILAIPTNMSGVARNSFIAVFAATLFVVLAFIQSPLMKWQGAILFGGIIAYLIFMFSLAKAGADDPILEEMTEIDEGEDGLPTNMVKSLVYVILGIAGLILGGKLIVDNAVAIAEGFGISETIIGLTIVAVGTSLPEIATVVVATYRGHPEVAIGNVLGSNVFNVFAVMGASALAGPIAIDNTLKVFDFWVMLVSSFVLLLFVLRRQPIGRKTGLAFTVAYALYILAVVARVM